jgi:hypothetical protein
LKADSGWLGGYPRNLCVTGTFTQSTQAQVAPRGPLSLGAYGDGLKRRNRQSRFDPSGACAPVGSARTPPPAFPFLLCTFQRASHRGRQPHTTARPSPPRREENETWCLDLPDTVSCHTGDCCPLVARQYVASRVGVDSRVTGSLSTPLCKYFRALALVVVGVTQMPQIGRHSASNG